MHSRKEDDSAQIAHAEGQLEAHKRRLDVLQFVGDQTRIGNIFETTT